MPAIEVLCRLHYRWGGLIRCICPLEGVYRRTRKGFDRGQRARKRLRVDVKRQEDILVAGLQHELLGCSLRSNEDGYDCKIVAAFVEILQIKRIVHDLINCGWLKSRCPYLEFKDDYDIA